MRIEGIKKLGFYALPPQTTALIAANLTINKRDDLKLFSLLDPCCGNGIPLRTFAETLRAQKIGAVTYGSEVSPDRAAAAKSMLDHVLADDYKNVQASNETFSLLYLNPPYDWEGKREDDERQDRQEYLFLRDTLPRLQIGGLLVYVIPHQTLGEVKLRRFLAGHFSELQVYAFPPEEYAQFKQLVIVGYRRKLDRHNDLEETLTYLAKYVDEMPPTLTAETPWLLPPSKRPSEEISFYRFNLTRQELLAAVAEHGVFSRPEWKQQRLEPMQAASIEFQPAVPMRPGHLSMLLLSGLLQTMILDKGRLMVKGRVEKVEVTEQRSEDETAITEQFVTKIFVLHDDGRYQVIDDEAGFQSFMFRYSADMASILEKRFTPLYQSPTQAEWDALAPLLLTKKLPGEQTAGLLDAQKHMVIAASRVLKKHKTATVVAEMGFGKASPLSSKLATPTGWTTMGEIKVGDSVIGADGKPTQVVGVYPQGVRPVYTLTFSDGTSVEADADHLWQVNTATRLHRGHGWFLKTTQELYVESSTYTHGGSKYRIPLCAPVEYSVQPDLPIEPYLLGLLLGDGTLQLHGINFTTADEELLASVRHLVPIEVNLHDNKRYTYRLTAKPGQPNPLLNQIRQLGLGGKTSYYKFIPDPYKRASIPARIALLQGLCDTDGTVEPKGGRVEYSTSSQQLALDVQELVESLGGTARLMSRIPGYTHKGERLTGAIAYRLHIHLPATIQPFRLQRKRNRYHGGATLRTLPKRLIRKIEFKGYEETQCIRVAAPDHLYLTGHFAVTHNTAIAASTLHLLDAYPAILIGPPHLTEKWADEFRDTVPDIMPVIVTNIVELRGVYEEYERKKGAGEPLPKLVVILSLQDGKKGSGWRIAHNKRKHYRRGRPLEGQEKGKVIVSTYPVTCPDCNHYAMDKEGLPVGHLRANKKLWCACGGAFWQYYHRFNPQLQRWPVARYIRTQLPRGWFKLLIADEVHDYKAGDTDQAQAYTDLVSAARMNLNLTGTWFGGKSKSIFYLMYRTILRVRQEFGFKEEEAWSQKFGRVETLIKYRDEYVNGAFTGNRRSSVQVRELPGINPAIVPYMLPTVLFASIQDLGYELPDYQEEIVRIPLSPAQQAEYEAYSKDLLEEFQAASPHEKAGWISVWQQTCLGRPDSIHREDKILVLSNEDVSVIKKKGDKFATYREFRVLPPLLGPGDLAPKEEWLLDTIADEVRQDRKALIYLRQTGTRNIQPRLLSILDRYGYRAQLIPDKVKPKDRASWIRDNARLIDCLPVNPRKVATGLDLVMFATAIVYEIEYSLTTLWQAIRRVWRLGQIHPVRVLFGVYEGTLEEAALTLMGQKMRAAYNIYGSVASSALADEGDGDNILDELTRHLLKHGKLKVEGFTGLIKQQEAQVSSWARRTAPTPAREMIIDGVAHRVDDADLVLPASVPQPTVEIISATTIDDIPELFGDWTERLEKPNPFKRKPARPRLNIKRKSSEELQLTLF